MVHKVFTFRDAKTEIFHSPFLQKTAGEAERTFTELVTDPKTLQNRYPEDWDMYFLGDYDDQTGKYQLLDTPQHHMKAINVRLPNISQN